MKRVLPEDFVWGAASGAYQIEGHSNEDGGGIPDKNNPLHCLNPGGEGDLLVAAKCLPI